MKIFLLGITLFAVAFIVHLIRWRLAPPKGSAAILIRLMVTVIVLTGIAGVLIEELEPAAAVWLPEGIGAWSESMALALGIAASYVMTYPAIEVYSPSFLIAEYLKEAGSRGLTRQELYARLNDAVVVLPHIQDLLDEGLAISETNVLHLSTRGRRVASVFMAWRRILGAPKGG